MKKILSLFVLLYLSHCAISQLITGNWDGVLKIQGTELRVVFHISESPTGLIATMDSPDQGANGIPVTKTTLVGSEITLEITAAQIVYKGNVKGDKIEGTFNQGNLSLPLELARMENALAEKTKPQDPIKPYPYISEDIQFENSKANITLSGTLTLPIQDGKFPVVILISGSGPQNRDEELMGHKPFLVISDYLTRNGIGVLRYDDRGVAQSKGNFQSATTRDFADDVNSAIAFLKTRKEIAQTKIGLMGHSEGGMIAPMVAAENKDVSFIVMLAGPGVRIDELMLLQAELISRASGVSESDIQTNQKVNRGAFDIVLASDKLDKMKSDLTTYMNAQFENPLNASLTKDVTREEFVDPAVQQLSAPWFQYFLKYDPSIALRNVKCPVLALNGEKDLQVPARQNLEAIGSILAKSGNKNVTTKSLAGLNHLFQECKTGSPDEYATIEQTFSPIALEQINTWIHEQVKSH